jgi:aldehyde:ferredoxin oxidoreductase
MDKLRGYAGKILEIDLTNRSINDSPLSPDLATKFIGGAGVNAWLAYNYIVPHTSPLSPENVLIFGAGPLVGTLAPCAGKTNFSSKSPLSHFIGTSGSGHMGMLKFTGYDHLVIRGKADTPVYLEIGDEVKIRDASHLWGQDTWETTDAIWRELGRQYAVASIGPAGENLVRNASIVANKYSVFAKTGMGAVMGSKNLKAIAAYGTRGVGVAESKRFLRLVNRMCQTLTGLPYFDEFRKFGTLIDLENEIKGKNLSIPYKNAQQVADEELMGSFGLDLLEQMADHRNIACMGCPIGCKHSFRLKEGPYAGLALGVSCAGAPTVCFGGICALEGWSEVMRCEELANRLGMDNASASTVAWAIELYQRGIIDSRDTGGLELDWRSSVVQDLLQKIAYREGFGDILADGLIEAPRRIGRGSDYYALNYKGVGNSTGDPRSVFNSWICSVITNVTGHATGVRLLLGQPRGKVERNLRHMGISDEDLTRVLSGPGDYSIAWLTKWNEDYTFALESLGVCFFDYNQTLGVNHWAEVYSAATGLETDAEGLLKAAARGLDIRKAFNVREGASRKDDTIPRRFLTEPIQFRGETRPPFDSAYLDQLVTDYYAARGWNPQDGSPSADRLAEITELGRNSNG